MTLTDEDAAIVRLYEQKIIPLRTIVGTFHDQPPRAGLRAAARISRDEPRLLSRSVAGYKVL